MTEKRGKPGKGVSKREAFRRERAALQQAQFARDAKAKRRAVIHPDKPLESGGGGSGEAFWYVSGTVENIISADDDFALPGKLIVDWADGCEIGGRYENGEFVKVA